MYDEQLRTALVDATTGQPEQPLDRMTAVRRRHIRRRAVQSAAAAMVAAVAVAATLLVGGTFAQRAAEPINRPVPSWALPWPDHRDGSVPQAVLDGAILAWQHEAPATSQPLPAPREVVWYVGQLVAEGNEVAVVFEAVGEDGSRRLVAGVAAASQVLDGQPPYRSRGFTPWILHDVPAPVPTYAGFIGLNAHSKSEDVDGFVHDWIVVLTSPDVHDVRWTADTTQGPHDYTTRPTRGLFVADAGAVVRPVRIQRVFDGDRHNSLSGGSVPVGVPGAPKSRIPQLADVAPLTGVPRQGRIGAASGQGAMTSVNASLRATGGTTVYGRCRGGRAISVTVDTIRDDAPAVTIPCDGAQHTVAGPPLRRHNPYGEGHSFEVRSTGYTAWAVIVVADDA